MARQRNDGSWSGTTNGKKEGSVFGGMNGAIVTGGRFDWADVPCALMNEAVAAVTRRGALISFSVNRSRTAGTITVLDGDAQPKLFCPDADAACKHLQELIRLAAT